jgi:DNA-binding LacI/PurR family transcriptional regulator/DNA-binding transcriptional regulator YhcF (GntR family)
MDNIDSGPSKVHWLAKHLEEDILTRGLRVGDPYWTTTQTGRQFGISKAMAYRAMKLLVERQILVSHPGRGTFVGPKAEIASPKKAKCIRILLMHDILQYTEQSTHGWLAGLVATLPGYSIQFDFIPQQDSETFVGQLLEHGLADRTISAAILLGCPRVIQELVFNRGVPALVLGTDYSSTRQLPSVDADQYEIGRLAAEYLLQRGARRIALLTREMWLPGDRRLFEGVGRAMDEAGLGHDSLMLRNLPPHAALMEADLDRLLADENRPQGCICRTPFFAEAMLRAANSAGLNVPDDLEVISDGLDRQTSARLSFPSVCMNVSVEEQMAIGGRMLAQLFEGRDPDPLHVVLPVELVAPTSQENQSLKTG